MRVGFIINSRAPSFQAIWKGMPPSALLFGWDDAGATMSYMRFRWIKRYLPKGIHYEIYKPWRSYDVVVFMKSMGAACMEIVHRLRKAGTAVIFEANVDYYTLGEDSVPMPDLAPTPRQRVDAELITKEADAVIASSRHLTQVCARFNPQAHWVPDNILPELCVHPTHWQATQDGKLKIWWSGMASKLFELLAAQESLRRLQNHIHLHMVTDNVSRGKAKWEPQIQKQFDTFLKTIPHTFHHFKSIPHLLKLYSSGGILIAPRFLEFPYNLGHSEWKITLGMAVGLPVLASPVPSYEDVVERMKANRVWICRKNSEWEEAFEWALSRPNKPSKAAQEVVRQHYTSPRVAEQHLQAVQSVL